MKKRSEKILFQSRWLKLKEAIYQNKHGQDVFWESVERIKQKHSVIVVPLLVPSNRIVLIKQYRFAIDDYILAFPAGISDGESSQALKELKEETGYTGVVVEQSPFLQINAGLMNEKTQIVIAHIDEKDPRNQNPTQTLEPSEDIDVVLAPKNNIKDFLLKESKKGTRIASNVWCALGINL